MFYVQSIENSKGAKQFFDYDDASSKNERNDY